MALEVFSPECVYAMKSNVAYPTVGASGATISSKAQTRLVDAFTDSTNAQTQRVTAITLANAPVVNN